MSYNYNFTGQLPFHWTGVGGKDRGVSLNVSSQSVLDVFKISVLYGSLVTGTKPLNPPTVKDTVRVSPGEIQK